MTRYRFSLRHPLLLVFGFLLLCSSTVISQEAVRPERGAMPNRSYSVSDIENINLVNGNVNLSIPLASLPPIAGGKLSWTITANYNSKQWNVIREQADSPLDSNWSPYVIDYPAIDGGWTVGDQYGLGLRNSNDDLNRLEYLGNSGLSQEEVNLVNNFSYWKMVLRTPDGAEHEFRPIDYTPYPGNVSFLKGYYNVFPNGTPTRYYSVDGTYMFARYTTATNWTVYMPDGTQIIQTPDGVQRIQDTNGNKIKIFSDTNGTHYQDEQTGREIRKTYDPSANGGQGQTRIWYKTVGGIDQHIDINWGTTTIQGKTYRINDWDPTGIGHVCQHETILESQITIVREILFPQTEPTQPQRHFTYDYNSDTTESASGPVSWDCSGNSETYTRQASRGWGELSRMTTPSGSIVDYSYSKDSIHFLFGSLDSLAKETIAQKKVTHDGTEDIWTYSIPNNEGTPSVGVTASVTSPDGQNLTETHYCVSNTGCANGRTGLVYRTQKPFLMTERHWTNLTFSGANTVTPSGSLSFNAVVDFEYTTLLDASNNKLKMSAKAFQYDYNGNITQTTEYDWFDPGLVSRDAQDVPTGVPASATVLRVTSNALYNQASGASSGNVYAKRSVSTGAPLILNATQQTTLGPSIIQLSYDGQAYGVAPTAGNVTTKKVWDDLDNKWITTSTTYDLNGNVATVTDGRGKVTQFFYDDAMHALPNRVVVDPQNGTGTQTATTSYDFSTGLVTSNTDANGQVTSIDYTNQLLNAVDPFGRPGLTRSPTININGANHRRRVTTTYLDAARQVITETDLNAENDKLLKIRMTSDMLGRPILSESTEDGTNYTISARNAYLNMGQVTLTASPMRSTAASTDSWTRVTKDGAGRVTEVATFGGSAQPAWTGTAGAFTGAVSTAYSANFTTITDQAGKVRRSMADALGRLLRVDEPDANGNLGSTTAPVQETDYEYDVLGNLKKVIQGAQQRTFTYDSLSRLRTVINPESGTINYQYDDNGNLAVKTDARSVSTHYEYDSINRVTRRWYNGSSSTSNTTHNVPALPSGVGPTDEVKFYYDSQALPGGAPSYSRGSAIGRPVAQTYGTGSNGDYYAYDVLGRPTLKLQQTGAVNFQITAGYTLSGAVSSLTYPSGNTISNTFDQAGRLTTFSGNLGGASRTYSTGNVYSSIGALLKEQFGTDTSVYHKVHYNSRAQICDVRTSTVNDEWGGEISALVNYYSYPYAHCGNGPDNNGNLLMSQTIINSVYFEDRYTYDSLNRLSDVNEYLNGSTFSGKQEYAYDRWGNRTLKPGASLGTYKEFTVNTANNRLGVPASQSPATMDYDSAGNLINDTYTGAGNRTYDGENKITSAWGGNNQAQLYGYDASGQRIKRTVDGVTTWQVYGFGGELLAEYAANGLAASPQKEYGYRNGELLVTASAASRVNFARSTNGATATAQNYTQDGVFAGYHFYPSYVIDGQRYGHLLAGGGDIDGFWRDEHGLPSWVEVNFNGSKTIDEINVFTTPECPACLIQADPSPTQTFSQYGVTGFEVQYWTGSSWATVPGGSISGNNLVWRKLTFTAITTSKIRVMVTAAATDGVARIDEIEAWTTSPNNNATVNWLVSDHLGTPRIILDQTGAYANVKRHDYLPFGEELFAPAGGRSTTLGYSAGDGVRQQFTAKERDVETGLDYFFARYYSSTQGRFTSVDPALDSAKGPTPQSWNRYAYCLNNPFKFMDPTGKRWAMQQNSDDGKWYYAWFATDKEYDAAIASGKFQAVDFDESKPYEFTYHEQSEIDLKVRLNPDGTHKTFSDVHPGPRGIDMMQNQAFDIAIGNATGAFVSRIIGKVVGAVFGRVATEAAEAAAVTNPVPSNLARVIPGEGPFPTLGAPHATDVFVTAAEDIGGMNAGQISTRLTIPPSETFTVIEFPTPSAGIATPINRANTGFVGFGRTAGGAREFVLPNGPIPANATIRIVQ